MGPGKLTVQCDEILVIDDGLLEEQGETKACESISEAPELAPEENQLHQSMVELDLIVQECNEDDDYFSTASSSSSSSSFPGGRMTARRLMQARAKSCVVCMEDKEHTFVPSHQSDAGGQVEGHRFCTDCWVDFLEHSLAQRPTSSGAVLCCPVCRSRISVPDVYTVDVDMPLGWTQSGQDSKQRQVEARVLPSIADLDDIRPLSWVDASEVSGDCSPPAGVVEGRPLCRRVWNSAVQRGLECLRGVMNATIDVCPERAQAA
eukprot:TRINITY_DN5476_c0_g1_i1.p1 TRINITY_DN5476_c0_g1~~TRINITY_DN5476_c0_g1_i1.p1  ORF type:complete len:296 (-),score=55.18 TRINITY_DN5476_c0_g1_i1:216-1001(-)